MNPIVPYTRSDIVRRRRNRDATSVLQLASSGVVADVHIERVDRRNACSWYAIRLSASTSDVTARLVGRSKGGDLEELGSVLAPAGAIGSGSFAVTTPRTGSYESIVLEIRSGEMLLHVDAPRPPAAPPSRALRAAAILAVAGVASLGAAAIPFALGAGASRPTPVPAASAAPAVVKAIPLPAARIQSFSARRDAVAGGRESVLASYLAVGERGTVALLDSDGIVVATAPFSRVGTVRLPVPRAYGMLPLTAQLTVHGGGAKAVSSVVIASTVLATTAPATPVPTASPAAADAAQGGNSGLLTVVGPALAGRPLNLRLAAQRTPVRIELEDEAGATITETQVPAGGTHAVLTLPPSSERTTYLVAMHYQRGGGEELLIRTVVALPH
jgi:hypothetical protein